MDYDFVESFNSYSAVEDVNTGLTTVWVELYDINDVTLSAGRYHGQALHLFSNGTDSPQIYRDIGFDDTEFSAHFSFRLVSGASNSIPAHVHFGQTTSSHIGLRFKQDGSIEILRGSRSTGLSGTAIGGTSLGMSAASVFAPDTWHTCHVRGSVDDTTGFVHVAINGADNVVLSLTGIDTRNSASHDVTQISLCASANSSDHNIDFDDILVRNDSSSMIPERTIRPLAPNGDGANLDFTPSTGVDHYAVVDGTLASLADYLSGTAVNDYDLLGLEDLPAPPAEIDGVLVIGYMSKTDSGTRAMALGIDSSGTVADGADHYLGTSAAKFQEYFAQDPDTVADWTYAGVNALQLQPKVTV